MNRRADKGRHIDRIDDFQVIRNDPRKVVDPVLDRLNRLQRVGLARQLDRDPRGRLPVPTANHAVAFRTHLDPCDITEGDKRAVLQDGQQDVFKLPGRGQQRLRRDRRVQLLALDAGRTPDLAGGQLHILCPDRLDDIDGRQIKLVQALRIHPNSHGVLRAEGLDLPDPVDPAQRLFDI